jgi:hypothetical protein
MTHAYRLQDTYGNSESPIFEDRVSLAKWVELHTDSEYLRTMVKDGNFIVGELKILSYNDLFNPDGTPNL